MTGKLPVIPPRIFAFETLIPSADQPYNPGVRLLVTGGAGFLGAAFVRFVARARPDWQITVIDKLTYAGDLRRLSDVRFHFVHGDILDARLAADVLVDQDAVVHFAAETHVDRSITRPRDFIQTNVLGTHALIEGSRLVWEGDKRPFVHISTDEVYGPVLKGRATEDWPHRPSSPYSASKVGAEAVVMAYGTTYGMDVRIVRPCNGYGPFQFPEKLIPRMTIRALLSKPLPVYGDGTQTRQWLHAEDIASGVLTVLEKGRPRTAYNLAPDNELQNIQIVNFIVKALNADPNLIQHVKDRPGHDTRYAMDSSKIKGLGWSVSVDLSAGLAETVKWFVQNRPWWEGFADDV